MTSIVKKLLCPVCQQFRSPRLLTISGNWLVNSYRPKQNNLSSFGPEYHKSLSKDSPDNSLRVKQCIENITWNLNVCSGRFPPAGALKYQLKGFRWSKEYSSPLYWNGLHCIDKQTSRYNIFCVMSIYWSADHKHDWIFHTACHCLWPDHHHQHVMPSVLGKQGSGQLTDYLLQKTIIESNEKTIPHRC